VAFELQCETGTTAAGYEEFAPEANSEAAAFEHNKETNDQTARDCPEAARFVTKRLKRR